MTETTAETEFRPPYGNADQHVYDPGQHHGYHWIVAHSVYNGETAARIIDKCRLAKAAGAPLDTVRQLQDTGRWKLITDYDEDEEMVHTWRTYVLALEAYEAALKDQAAKPKAIDITPKINQKYPLQVWAMSLGMYGVTDKNWPEFYVRIKLYEEMQDGSPLLQYTETKEPVPVTPELAKQHIGCRLGDQNLTREQWWLRLLKSRASSFQYQAEEFAGAELFPEPEDQEW